MFILIPHAAKGRVMLVRLSHVHYSDVMMGTIESQTLKFIRLDEMWHINEIIAIQKN